MDALSKVAISLLHEECLQEKGAGSGQGLRQDHGFISRNRYFHLWRESSSLHATNEAVVHGEANGWRDWKLLVC